ncbi:hypothetical protein EVAR_50558_1 [Eumeta japonica]|uniref:HAT C-terminal dimerisation domain-containing protein n=1 Tax=Eumeta variegata TaxID=151549 RepID=A0A4C2AIC9_EUMVA|nr:hypothetical protein EVAR_50558_1 [Eumeta japonica]
MEHAQSQAFVLGFIQSCDKNQRLNKTTAQNEVESDSLDHSEKPEDNFSLWEDHQKLVRKNWKTSKTDGTISDELFIYLRSPVGRLDENPLDIWNNLKIQLPKLHIIAYKYLTMVRTSVPSERLFSKATQIVNQQHHRDCGGAGVTPGPAQTPRAPKPPPALMQDKERRSKLYKIYAAEDKNELPRM